MKFSKTRFSSILELSNISAKLSVSRVNDISSFGSGASSPIKIKNGTLWSPITRIGLCRWGLELNDKSEIRYYEVRANVNEELWQTTCEALQGVVQTANEKQVDEVLEKEKRSEEIIEIVRVKEVDLPDAGLLKEWGINILEADIAIIDDSKVKSVLPFIKDSKIFIFDLTTYLVKETDQIISNRY